MAGILTSLQNTVIAGIVLAVLLFALFLGTGGAMDYAFYTFFFPLAACAQRRNVDRYSLVFQFRPNS